MNRFFDVVFRQYKCYVTVALVLINVIVFGWMFLENIGYSAEFSSLFMIKNGAMDSDCLEKGEYYRLFTSMFLHFDMKHLGNNMLVLAAIGSTTERYMGSISFLIVYLIGGLGGNLISAVIYAGQSQPVVSAGASGAVFAVIGALLCVVILNKGKLENFTTTRVMFFIVLVLYQGMANTGVNNYAHVGGLVTGFVTALICCLITGIRSGNSGGRNDYTYNPYDRMY